MRSTNYESFDGFEVLDSSKAASVYGGASVTSLIRIVAKAISFAWAHKEEFMRGFNQGYADATR